MTEFIIGFAHGFGLLFTPSLLSACMLGVLAGTVGGFLPTLSPLGAVALALSLAGAIFVAFGVESPVVFAIAVAYGTIYGRVLAVRNLETSDPLKDVSGPDRRVLVGGLIAAIGVAAAMGLVAAIGRPTIPLVLGPAELVGILIFLLLAGVAFATGSAIGALAAVVVGLLLSAVGTDIETGAPRFTLGIPALEDGVPGVALGLFVIAGAIHDWRHARVDIPRHVVERSSRGALRRTILAVLAGFLPTNGGLVGTTTSERQLRPNRDILDPASQSDLYGAFGAALAADIRFSVSLVVPLMVWFAPSDVVTALLRKIISTQEVLTQQPWPRTDIVWLVCATLILVHVVPLIMWVTTGLRWQPIRLDARIIAPLTIATCCALVFAITRSVFDYSLARSLFNIAFMLGFGVIGYGMFRLNVDRTLLLFAFLLEPTLEENFGRSLLIARGDVAIFFQRPISFGFLAAGMLLLIAVRLWRSNADKRQLTEV